MKPLSPASALPAGPAPAGLRLLIVAEPTVDGVFVYCEWLVPTLLAAGFAVDYAYSSCRTCDRLPQLVGRVEQHGGSCLDLRTINRPTPADLPAFLRLARFIRRRRPDLILAMSTKAGVLVRSLSLLGLSVPVLFQPHAYYGLGRERKFMIRLVNAVESALGEIGHTLTVSPSEYAFARRDLRLPPERLTYIPQPVDNRRFHPATPKERAAARRALGLPASGTVVSSFSRISFQKDPVTLHEAWAVVARRHPDWRFVHVGGGRELGEVQAIARRLGHGDRVLWIDHLRQPELVYHASDLLVQTPRYEGMSLVALEGLACGLPLVLTRAPGNIDLATMGWSHLWYADVADSAGVAAAIEQWTAERDRPNNHAALIAAQFSPERTAQGLRETFRRALAPYSGPIV